MPTLVDILALEKNIFKFRQCIFAISLSSPLRKRCGRYFEQTEILSTQACFVPRLVGIGPVDLKKISAEIAFNSDSLIVNCTCHLDGY